jgi:hypothetical protein
VLHATILVLALLVPRCDASATRCCTTLEIRRDDSGALRCHDTAALKCYGARQGPGSMQMVKMAHRTASCEDGGFAFWSCVQALGDRLDPTPSPVAAQQLEPEPEPSPRWDVPSPQAHSRAKMGPDQETLGQAH